MNVPWAIPNIKDEDIRYVKQVLDSGWYTMGKQVKKLEEDMSKYVGVKNAIATNNGTTALEVMFRTVNIKPGDEIIVPAHSYIASATAVRLVGATPVFVDVDMYMNIDPESINDAITDKTKAVLAVDLTGNPCDYDKLENKCKENDIMLLVDGAQSLGSTYKNKSCIANGIMSTTSFHAAKVLTTVEGGMVFTNNNELAEIARAIRTQGESGEKYVHKYLGGNYRMTDISAAFAIKQLERYNITLKERKAKVDYYKKLLGDVVAFVDARQESISCNFIFPILHYDCDGLAKFLNENGIGTRRIYPMTIPQQPIFNVKKSYPLAEWFCQKTLSLPLYADLTFKQIEYVCDKVKEHVKK